EITFLFNVAHPGLFLCICTSPFQIASLSLEALIFLRRHVIWYMYDYININLSMIILFLRWRRQLCQQNSSIKSYMTRSYCVTGNSRFPEIQVLDIGKTMSLTCA